MRLEEVKSLNHSDDFIFGVAIGRDGNFNHCSILYKWGDEIRTIDFYNQIIRRQITIGDLGHWDYLYVKYDRDYIIDPIAEQIPSLCELIKEKNSKITFGIRFTETRFNQEGELILANGDFGLTCATFVLALLDGGGITLIDLPDWQQRREDEAWQKKILNYYEVEMPGTYDDSLLEHYKTNIGCFRYRPEEVAAASSSTNLPTNFIYCEEYGRRINEALDYGLESYKGAYL